MYFFASRCLRLSVVFLCVPALFSSSCDLLLVRQNVATFGGQNFGSFGGQNFGSFPPSGISPPWHLCRSCRASDRPPVVIFGRFAAACSSARISEAAAAGAGSSARISEAVRSCASSAGSPAAAVCVFLSHFLRAVFFAHFARFMFPKMELPRGAVRRSSLRIGSRRISPPWHLRRI